MPIDLFITPSYGCFYRHSREELAMRSIAGALASWKEQARSSGIRERGIAMMDDSIGPRLEAVTAAARTV